MNLKTLLTGGPEVQQARAVVKELGGKKDIGYANSQRLDEASSVLWRWRAKMGAVLAVVLGVGGAGGYMAMDNDGSLDVSNESVVASAPATKAVSSDVPEQVMETRGQKLERETDELIGKVEKAFAMYEARVSSLVDSSTENPGLKAELMVPFEVVKANTGYSNKNAVRFYDGLNGRTGQIDSGKTHPYQFMYLATDKMAAGTAASYDAFTSKMFIAPDWEGTNGLDFLLSYHELKHVAQFAQLMSTIQSQEQYQAFYDFQADKPGRKRRVLVQLEVNAYACEMEMLNMMLEGTVKAAAEQGQMIKVDDVKKRLNITDPADVKMMAGMLKMGQIYYESGGLHPVGDGSSLGVGDEFFQMIIDLHKQQGVEVYVGSPINGSLRQIG